MQEPLITLVSYPRSGNTFLRNVLFEVYGMSSATFLKEGHGPDYGWNEFSVVKTHHLPNELPDTLLKRKIVLLIRDGRDAVVSFAHHRKDIVASDSSFNQNLWEAIYAAEGSHFGGWSLHTEEWLKRADLVIRFEELIHEPRLICERLGDLMKLPNANWDRLPDFITLKQGSPEYGSGKYVEGLYLADKWFRRGVVNGWKDEMSTEMQRIFWHLHGETMELVCYSFDGSYSEFNDQRPSPLELQRNILIEAGKLLDAHMDGIGRYVQEILAASQKWPTSPIRLKALVGGRILEIDEALRIEDGPVVKSRILRGIKRLLKQILPYSFYHALARWYNLQRRNRKRVAQNNALIHENFDLIHLTLPQNFETVVEFNLPVIATIHDLTHLSHPNLHELNNINKAKSGMQYLINCGADYLVPSRSTQQDLSKYNLTSKFIPEGVNRRKFYPHRNEHWLKFIRDRYGLPEGKYLLSVCTLEPRKNLKVLIEAYKLLDQVTREQYPLVLVGRKGWKWDESIVPTSLKEFIRFTGYVSDPHLSAIYSMATGFCYLSLYEGFGLPVLEAMACGCPVMVADSSSLPELIDENSIKCDPTDLPVVKSGLLGLISLGEDKQARNLAIEHSWKFSWKSTWMATAEFYQVTLGEINGPAKKDQKTIPN